MFNSFFHMLNSNFQNTVNIQNNINSMKKVKEFAPEKTSFNQSEKDFLLSQRMPECLADKTNIQYDDFLTCVDMKSSIVNKPIPEKKPIAGIKIINMQVNDCKDIASVSMYLNGIDPSVNKNLKKLYAMDIIEYLIDEKCYLCKYENDVFIDMNKILLSANHNDILTSGVFKEYIKKITKAIKKAGLNVERTVLKPIRETLKKSAPALWSGIDKLDRQWGLTKYLKKWHSEIEKLSYKYGEQVITTAIMLSVSTFGTPAAGLAVSTLLNVANNYFDQKEMERIKKIQAEMQKNKKLSAIDLQQLKLMFYAKIKDLMIKEKGSEGKKDFNEMLKMAESVKNDFNKSLPQTTGLCLHGTFNNPIFMSLILPII